MGHINDNLRAFRTAVRWAVAIEAALLLAPLTATSPAPHASVHDTRTTDAVVGSPFEPLCHHQNDHPTTTPCHASATGSQPQHRHQRRTPSRHDHGLNHALSPPPQRHRTVLSFHAKHRDDRDSTEDTPRTCTDGDGKSDDTCPPNRHHHHHHPERLRDQGEGATVREFNFNLHHPPLEWMSVAWDVPALGQWALPLVAAVVTASAAGAGTAVTLLCEGPVPWLPTMLVAVLWTWLWTCDAVLYNNHYYLYSVFLVLDALGTMGGDPPRVAAYHVRMQVGIVYTWAAFAKLDADWLDGTVMEAILDHPDRVWVRHSVVHACGRVSATAADHLDAYLAVIMAWSGMVLLAGAPWALVASRRWVRVMAQMVVGMFHVSNLSLFGVSGIGCFSMVMLASLRLYPVGLVGTCAPYPNSSWWGRGLVLKSSMAPLMVLGVQVWIPLQQYMGAMTLSLPPGWGMMHDRWAWRMKATVQRLSVDVPMPVVTRHAATTGLPPSYTTVPLCDMTVNGTSVFLHELNPSQREAVCLRPAATRQYAQHVLGRPRHWPLDTDRSGGRHRGTLGYPASSVDDPGHHDHHNHHRKTANNHDNNEQDEAASSQSQLSICLNTWLALNRHPFQPRYNTSVPPPIVSLVAAPTLHPSLSSSSTPSPPTTSTAFEAAGAGPLRRDTVLPLSVASGCHPHFHNVLPWQRQYGRHASQWSATYKTVQQTFHEGGYTVDFFAMPPWTSAWLPWFQHASLPSFIHVLDGVVVLQLQPRPGGAVTSFVVGQSTLPREDDRHQSTPHIAEFPRVLHAWWISPSSTSAFFALAWQQQKSSL
eukprot:m.121289 g.121289  ORF g.121289 m.121289 type:complete len:816 (-) comp11079_c1_seq4:138-2585(-)